MDQNPVPSTPPSQPTSAVSRQSSFSWGDLVPMSAARHSELVESPLTLQRRGGEGLGSASRCSSFSWDVVPSPPCARVLEAESVSSPARRVPADPSPACVDFHHTPSPYIGTSRDPACDNMEVEESLNAPPAEPGEVLRLTRAHSSPSRDAVLPPPPTGAMEIDHCLTATEAPAPDISSTIFGPGDTQSQMNVDASEGPSSPSTTMTETEIGSPIVRSRKSPPTNFKSSDVQRMDEDPQLTPTPAIVAKTQEYPLHRPLFSVAGGTLNLTAGMTERVTNSGTPNAALGLGHLQPGNTSFSWNPVTNTAISNAFGLPSPDHRTLSRTPPKSSSFSWDHTPPPPATSTAFRNRVSPTPRFQIAPRPPPTNLRQPSFSWNYLSPSVDIRGVAREKAPFMPQPLRREAGKLKNVGSSFSWDTDVLAMETDSVFPNTWQPSPVPVPISHSPASFSFGNSPSGK